MSDQLARLTKTEQQHYTRLYPYSANSELAIPATPIQYPCSWQKTAVSLLLLRKLPVCFVLHVAARISTNVTRNPNEADPLIPTDIARVSFIWPSLQKTSS